jgi:hypothetical protein
MQTLIGRARATKKHQDDEAERKADAAFLQRMKKRKPTPPDQLIPWEKVKKDLGL